jgi:nucleoside H+ symporter
VFILWGIGAFVGTMLAGKVLALHTLKDVSGPIQHNWREIWMTPAIGASAVLVIFLIFFREPTRKTTEPAFVQTTDPELETV